MAALNWLAIIAAAVSAFVLGGIWYGPLFKNAWCREAGVDPDAPQKRHPAGVFAMAFVASLVAAFGFAWYIGPNPEVHSAIHAGLMIGFFWVATRPGWVGELSQGGGFTSHKPAGKWWAAVPKIHWPKDAPSKSRIASMWDGSWGDRRQELVFIGTAEMDETPGTTSNGIFASTSASASSPPRPKI